MQTHTHTTLSATKISALALLSLSLLGGTSLPAIAGPDDGKIVTTRGHVDAPKTFWNDGVFTLKNEANPYGTGSQNFDLDKTVNWIGKGYARNNGSQQYIFTVPENSALSFLGEPGDNLYMGPAAPNGPEPIWAGLGADIDIPTDQFRDGTFVTDILSVEGPGAMELFGYYESDSPAALTRLLSSTETGWQSMPMTAGNHTHNYTTFSKPGRYVVTYRAVARTKDGALVQSAPQQLSWQVGGKSPISGQGIPNAVSTQDRYAAAAVGNLAGEDYKLTLAPHTGTEHDGDNALTDITFSDQRGGSGKLTLFINGYFLSDLEVENGSITWSEMLGAESSTIQAVYTPDGGGARWISQPLGYEPGEEDSTSSAEGEGSWPTEIPDARNKSLPTGSYTPTSGNYTVTTAPGENETTVVEVRFADPKIRGFIDGGLYETASEEHPELPIKTNIVDGVARFVLDSDDWYKGYSYKLRIIPHPDMNMSGASLTLKETYSLDGTQQQSGTLELGQASPEPTTEPAPNTSAEPSSSAEPSPSASPQPSKTAEPLAPVAPTASPTNTAMPSPSAPSPSTSSSPASSAPAPSSSASASPAGSQTARPDAKASDKPSAGATSSASSGSTSKVEASKKSLAYTGASVLGISLAGLTLLALGALALRRRRA